MRTVGIWCCLSLNIWKPQRGSQRDGPNRVLLLVEKKTRIFTSSMVLKFSYSHFIEVLLKFSYFHRKVREWNNLPLNLRLTDSLGKFLNLPKEWWFKNHRLSLICIVMRILFNWLLTFQLLLVYCTFVKKGLIIMLFTWGELFLCNVITETLLQIKFNYWYFLPLPIYFAFDKNCHNYVIYLGWIVSLYFYNWNFVKHKVEVNALTILIRFKPWD